ncbi:MAG: mismatch-specific DNA-glycosylase [Alphaproteobacteria bacterium]
MAARRIKRNERPAAILPDVLARGLGVIFCGSAAGRKSAELGAYYAGPGNRFWRTLHETGLTPRRLEPGEFQGVLEYGLGLTDMAKFEFGGDRELSKAADDPETLRAKIVRYEPRVLAFTAKRPARVFLDRDVEYGLQRDARIGVTEIFVLTSPSGAARAYWDEGPWRELAALVGRR